MQTSVAARLSQRFQDRGMRRGDALMLGVATLVAWNEDRSATAARDLFSGLAARLPSARFGDAVEATKEWLQEPALSAVNWESVDGALQNLHRDLSGPIDWNVEIGACVSPYGSPEIFALSLPLAKAVVRVLDYPVTGTFACLYSASASVAWILAEDRDVTLYADRDLAIMVALLARAACRNLKVSRLNPLDGTAMPGPFFWESGEHRPPFNRFDHIWSAPPFGGRVNQGTFKGVPWEALHLDKLADRASNSFTALVSDGVLFRDTRYESELRSKLLDQHELNVMSMPSGMYWPATGVSTSLIKLEPKTRDSVRMIDARSMEKSSSGRVQERLIIQHLENFRGFRATDEAQEALIPLEEIADNGFSLLPARYLRSDTFAQIEKALEARPTLVLSEIASIERNKAPLPLRDQVEEPALSALEIAPMDVGGGAVRTPTRQQSYEGSEAARVKGVTVQPDDILVSIKGNIGNVGIVGIGATLAQQLDEPWVISQSLAIVRLKPNPHIASAAVLNALLSAPWVRERLDSMSGGATVKSLPMSALRSLSVPIPTAEECAVAEAELDALAELREQIEKQSEALAERQRHLWAQLWHMPAHLGED